MSNIIGSPFDTFVKDQIDLRQQTLGKSKNIDYDALRYYTTKTPWLRLASSINVEATTVNGAEDPTSVYNRLLLAGFSEDQIRGENLSRNLILQGGVVSVNKPKDENGNDIDGESLQFSGQKFGLSPNLDSNSIFEGAYGFGGVGERGFVPMPGITSATTQYYNNGALSKATVNIKCFNRAQFALLDALYLRPGYTLLLEFGWSVYLSNNSFGGISTFPSFKTDPLEFLLDPEAFSSNYKPSQYSMQSLINLEREKYSGNYEAVYGKVTNFKWSVDNDGVYNCSIDLIGVGSILESLKLNVIKITKSTTQKTKDSGFKSEYQSKDEWIEELFGSGLNQISRALNDEYTTKFPTFTEFVKQVQRSKTAKKYYFKNGSGGSAVAKEAESTKAWTNFKEEINQRYEAYKTGVDEAADAQQQNDDNNPLIANKDTTILNNIFYQTYQTLDSIKDGGVQFSKNTIPSMKNAGMIIPNTYNGEILIPGQGQSSTSAFIKFAYLLQIIEKKCNLFSSINNGTPLMKFDFQYNNMEEDENYMAIIPPNVSTNPQKCAVPYASAVIKGIVDKDQLYSTYISEGKVEEGVKIDFKTDTDLNKSMVENSGFIVEGNPYVGRLGNVMINLRFAAQALSEAPRDEDGGVAVISYLQTILQGINSSMGSINNFMVVNDESSGYIRIYDESPMPNIIPSIEDDKLSTINIFGMPQSEKEFVDLEDGEFSTVKFGSFVTNIGLDAEIPQNFSTLVSIGSQNSGGNTLQGNAYSFNTYNRGLVDRIIPTKSSKPTSDKPNPIVEISTIFREKLIGPFEEVYLEGKSYNFHPDVTGNFTENYTTYIKLVQGLAAQFNRIPKPFFLPFNLNIEMEGLSGMRLFEKFRVTDDILPPSYAKDSVDIIVKGINHNIDVQSWKTTLDTLSVPRFKEDIIVSDSGSKSTSDLSKRIEATTEDPIVPDSNKDQIVRLRLTRLVDNGYQTLGLMEVLAENGDTLYTLTTAELPYNDNINNDSCIPLGTYTIVSRNSPKYKNHFLVSELTKNKGKVGTVGEGALSTPLGPAVNDARNNTAPRADVLIHEAPSAKNNDGSNWLLGCIAPGFTFNINQSGPKGNPRGTGPAYGRDGRSHKQSRLAVEKILKTLWNVGEDPMFKMEIVALGGGVDGKPVHTDFYNDPVVRDKITQLEDFEGSFDSIL